MVIIIGTGSLQIVWHNGRKIWITREIRRVNDGEGSSGGLSGLALNLSSLLQRNQESFYIRFV